MVYEKSKWDNNTSLKQLMEDCVNDTKFYNDSNANAQLAVALYKTRIKILKRRAKL